ncbi:MAG: EAL domain-containing protein [Marinobacterium sp.]|nr:EAL domain-containing protein [Marinobacterium sp.]
MTIYRQLLLLIWMTMVISLLTVLTVNLQSSADSLQSQQRLNINSALTALGMRLSPHLDPVDPVSVEVNLNAAFDGAYYRRIQVEIFETEQVLERHNNAQPAGVPDWFIGLFDIQPYRAVAPVASGWTESAEITIEGHTGFVYRQLWRLSTDLLLLYGTLFILIALLSSIGLRALVRPLQQIEHQARAIENRDFSYRVPEPRTRELRRVVAALNRLTGILSERFSENAGQLEQLHNRLQQDSETGLANRRYLLNTFEARLADPDSDFALIMVRLQQADSLRKRYGYQRWMTLVNSCVEQLQAAFGQPDMMIGRMSEAEFAVLLPALPEETRNPALHKLQQALQALHEQGIAPEAELFSLAGTAVQQGDSIGTVLTRLDNLLREARARGADQLCWDEGDNHQTWRTGQAWVELLRQRIEARALTLRHQPLVAELGGAPLHNEIYVRLLDEQGAEMNAGTFLPVVEQFELGAQLDLAVLEKMLESNSDTLESNNTVLKSNSAPLKSNNGTPQALNVSLSALRDTAFLSRLAALTSAQRRQICIEFPETHLQREPDAVASFTSILHSLGLSFGIDNVASGALSLDYIARLRPHYVKVAPALCRAPDDAGLALMTGVCNTVHNLDIPVYATVVENEVQLERLEATGINGFQGYINDRVTLAPA